MGDTKSKIAYLKSVIQEVNGEYACIVALEEVTERAYLEIIKEPIFENSVYSLNFRKQGQLEGRNRGLGCLIAGIGNIGIISSSLINRALFPERTLSVNVRLKQTEFEVICFHALTGVDHLKAKSAQFATFADYLHIRRDNPMILCADLNEPKIDHFELDQVEFFDQNGDKGKYASYILRPDGVHNLQDAYRLWLSQNNEEFVKHKNEEQTISTPLAVSYVIRGNNKKRYDYIMISPHWKVKKLEYRYEEAIKYGSDHAIVVADLEWEEAKQTPED